MSSHPAAAFHQTNCGTLTVEEETTFDPTLVTIGQCGQDFPLTLAAGASTTVRVICTNTNDVDAQLDIIMEADGTEIGRLSGAIVAAGSNQEFDISITAPATAATYSVSARKSGVTAASVAEARQPTGSMTRADGGAVEMGDCGCGDSQASAPGASSPTRPFEALSFTG